MIESESRELFLQKIREMDNFISRDIQIDNIEICYEEEYLNDYYGLKNAFACALLFSNYSNNHGNILKFMASNNVFLNENNLLSFCKSNDDINYLKYIITDTLNCYTALRPNNYFGDTNVLYVNPYKYVPTIEITDFSINSLNTPIENDQIIRILTKVIDILENMRLNI
jgi:hypothetical protein